MTDSQLAPKSAVAPIGTEFLDRPRHVSAAGLAGSLLAERFCFWRGRSGRKYVFSVYRAGAANDFAAMPRYAEAVVIAAARTEGGARRMLRVGQTGCFPELEIDGPSGFAALCGADELHVHLLASSRAERAAVLDDLGAEIERRAGSWQMA